MQDPETALPTSNNEPLNDGAQHSWVRVYADAGTKHLAFFVWGSGEVSLGKGSLAWILIRSDDDRGPMRFSLTWSLSP